LFRYQLHLADGTNAGEATYPVMIQPGEEIIVAETTSCFRVLDLIPNPLVPGSNPGGPISSLPQDPLRVCRFARRVG
jgi:hypothetical protein